MMLARWYPAACFAWTGRLHVSFVAQATSVTLVLLLFISTGQAWAGGPKHIASSDRSLWPYPLHSRRAFDLASRAEILAFARTLGNEVDKRDPAELKTWLGLRSVDHVSIQQWLRQTGRVLVANFNMASTTCKTATDLFCSPHQLHDMAEVKAYATQAWQTLPKNLAHWASAQQQFYATYLYEQLRLAALFPHITSEILPVDDSEIMGVDYPDRSFLLTFDDGPTPAAGNTDHLIALLRSKHLSGIFFLLGNHLKTRIARQNTSTLKQLYSGMCIGSHGFVHHPHPRMPDWQASLDRTKSLLTSILPPGQKDVKYFRPPYGQRTLQISQYVRAHGMQDMLWNIDSQDWNRHVSAKQIIGRMVTLMLLWRRGILLFHDIHPKVQQALPAVLDATRDTGVRWRHCL